MSKYRNITFQYQRERCYADEQSKYVAEILFIGNDKKIINKLIDSTNIKISIIDINALQNKKTCRRILETVKDYDCIIFDTVSEHDEEFLKKTILKYTEHAVSFASFTSTNKANAIYRYILECKLKESLRESGLDDMNEIIKQRYA